MKKIYVSVILFLAAITTTNAQVLLTQSNHAPVAGDMYSVFQVDSSVIAPGASGTGVTWNFSAATRTTIIVNNTYTTGSSQPNASYYPAGSVARNAATGRQFYTNSASQMSFWGGNFPVAAVSQTVDYYFNSPGAIQASYPMAYNTNTNSAFTGSVLSSLGNGPVVGTATVFADGTGTLSLPARSFSNVLRVKTDAAFNFTVNGFTTVTGSVMQETYDYYSTLTDFPSTKLFPLFSIVSSTVNAGSFGSQSVTYAYLNKDYQYVGINENTKEISGLSVFPNPVKNHFNISFTNENADPVSYELLNVIGQSFKKENLGNQSGKVNYTVNVSDLQSGMYFIRVSAGSKVSLKKITIQ